MTDSSSDPSSTECCKFFVRRWWWTAFLTIPALTLVGLVAGALMVYQAMPTYEAYATLERSKAAGSPNWSALTNTAWFDSAAASMPMSGGVLSEGVVTKMDASGRFQLGFQSSDPNEAAEVANALAHHWLGGSGPTSNESEGNQYLGRVMIQINPEIHDWDIFDNGDASGSARSTATDHFIETEQKIISSKKTLYGAIDNLKLHERWDRSKGDAYKKLLERLTVRREGATALIVIEYLGDEPQLTRDIANAVAKAYRDRRMSIESQRSSAALDTLQKQLKDQNDKVEEARLRMLDLAERYRIIDLAALNATASATGDPVTGQGQILMSSMQDTYKAEAAIARTKMQIKTLAGLDEDSLINAVASLELADVTFDSLHAKYQDLNAQRASLELSELKSKDIDEGIARLSALLKETVMSIRKTLSTKLSMAEQAMVLAKDLEESKKDDSMDERRKVAEYSEASKEYELQKGMLANMQSKFATETVDLTMPKTPITVHEDAEIPSVPTNKVSGGKDYQVVSWAVPNSKPLPKVWAPNLLGGSGLGLLLSLLLTVPVMRLHEAVFG